MLVPKVLIRKMGVILFLLPACLFRLSDLHYKGCLLLCMMPEKQGPYSDLPKRQCCYANYNLKPHWRYFKNKKNPRISRSMIFLGKNLTFIMLHQIWISFPTSSTFVTLFFEIIRNVVLEGLLSIAMCIYCISWSSYVFTTVH